MNSKKLQAQINAIERNIGAGKAANPYAAKLLVIKLKKRLAEIERIKAWDNFLSR